jgi:hypothetical protein
MLHQFATVSLQSRFDVLCRTNNFRYANRNLCDSETSVVQHLNVRMVITQDEMNEYPSLFPLTRNSRCPIFKKTCCPGSSTSMTVERLCPPNLSHRQSVLLRQFLQRHLRPRADVLDHLGRRKRP